MMSANSLSNPLPSTTATGVGFGYGIAIAVGILVLISTILLASYLCVRIKTSSRGGPHTDGSAVILAPVPAPAPAPAHAPAGLDGPTIDSYYPKFPFLHVAGGKPPADPAAAGPCAICLGDYAEGEAVRRVPECGHCFHAACVDEWLHVSATCPSCRSSPIPTPVSTPLSELIPLAVRPR